MKSKLEPSPESSEAARVALLALQEVGASPSEAKVELAVPGGEVLSVRLPPEALHALLDVLGQLANGTAVTVVPSHAELTTQQAADILTLAHSADDVRGMVGGPPELVEQFAGRVGRR